ncbi:MAG: RNA-binding protein [Chitinophagaceae bacterium]|nr:MAG: RNA-binding protein [Chitinophagaceae bacterium]
MKIYIANFPGTVSCADLKSFVAPFGIASRSEIALDSFTGVSRGFGYVTMEDEEAKTAIATLHDTEWNGLRVTVQEAAPERKLAGSYKSASGGPVQPYSFRKK